MLRHEQEGMFDNITASFQHETLMAAEGQAELIRLLEKRKQA